MHMEDTRIPKALFYGQLKDSARREGRPLLRYTQIQHKALVG